MGQGQKAECKFYNASSPDVVNAMVTYSGVILFFFHFAQKHELG